MANTRISNDLAKNAADEITALLDAGADACYIRLYDGTQPSGGPDSSVPTGATLIAELRGNDTATFGAASDDDPGGKVTANSISDDSSANASGTPTWFRALDSDENAVIDGDAGTGTGNDLVLDSAPISAGATVSITSWTVTMPES